MSINANAAEFRKAASCVKCHVSMDRISSVARNLRYTQANSAERKGAYFLMSQAANEASESVDIGWSAVADPIFYKRPPKGVFYFRDYKGNLKNISLNGVASLGPALNSMDDPYICMAKRYYSYFYGVDVSLGDPGETGLLSEDKQFHLNRVIEYGKALREDPKQSLRSMIEAMLRSPAYKATSPGVDK